MTGLVVRGRGYQRPVDANLRRAAAAASAWAGVLAFIFIGFVGEWTAVDWAGAGATALLAALLTVPMTLEGLFSLKGRVRWVGELASPFGQLFIDFGIITAFLARSMVAGRRGTGVFVARKFDAGKKDPEATARRGFVMLAATLSPNSYVIDINAEEDQRLAHDLVPRRASERPA